MEKKWFCKTAQLALAAAVTAAAVPAVARAESVPVYLGYTGKKWDRDYGVSDGRCNRQAVGALLASEPGVRASKGKVRQVATLIGEMTASAGGESRMDQQDRACVGHALELASVERSVSWTSADSGVAYRVIPLGGFTENGRLCREFVTRVAAGGRDASVRHKACSIGDGIWQITG